MCAQFELELGINLNHAYYVLELLPIVDKDVINDFEYDFAHEPVGVLQFDVCREHVL